MDAERSSSAVVWLVCPASSPGRFGAARRSGADVALLDLEDSVPAARKDAARGAVADWLAQPSQDKTRRCEGVRVNGLGTSAGLKDLVALAERGLRPAVVLVPKAESARDIEIVAEVTGLAEGGERRVWALIETPRGVRNLDAILASPVLAGVAFGAADYAAASGIALSPRALWHPRAAVTAGASAAGLPALDSPGFDLSGGEELRREAQEAAELGFAGKVAVHPRQIPVIREAFRPSTEALAHARDVVAAADAADGEITAVGGLMVGPPLVSAARALARRAASYPSTT
ncbi:HpcH/HpaI aldolase/citrate lyase family protein [Streptomyces sp. NPDC056716]|uniref:HpcH/HpaI aldolase/citrate lyase family protein n=1 Tax=unclassified Streptomyces TaxID=2593676 RepID=UPI00369BB1F9